MQLTAIQKANVTDDADPRLTPPTAARIMLVPAFCDRAQKLATQSLVLRIRVKVAAGTLATSGAAVLTLYVLDATSGLWTKVDGSPSTVLSDQLYTIGYPALVGATQAFVQLTGIVGTSADHVEIGWEAGGPAALHAGAAGTITSASGVLNTLGVVKYNATKPSLLDGQLTEMQGTNRGALLVANDEIPQAQDDTNRVVWTHDRPLADGTAGNTLTWVHALNGNGSVGKSSAGRLYRIFVQVTSAKYIQLHNATAAPADTTAPLIGWYVPAGGSLDLDLSVHGMYFSTGIYICASDTQATKTLSTSSDTQISVGVA